MTIYPVILAGGSGTRLWPLSRELYPKQFLTLTGERSLLQETLCRLDGFELSIASPIIVCNEEHRFLVGENVRQLGMSSLPIILEPDGRNTAPALTLAALLIADTCQSQDSNDPVMLVMPSDHVIKDVEAFQSVVCQGAEHAASGCLVTFGVTPTSPMTEYGYIEKGESVNEAMSNDMEKTRNRGKQAASKIPSFRVSAFVEKPKKKAARSMLETGKYLWNSGIFMMRVSVWLDQLRRHRPDIAEVCIKAYNRDHKDGDFYRPDAKIFSECPSDSIDYAVMEKIGLESKQKGSTLLLAESEPATHGSPDCIVLTLDAGWSDLGAWSTLWEEGNKDSRGNVIQGEVYSYSTRDSLIIAQHRLVAAIGLEDIVIVETADAVLAGHKDYVHEVKSLVARLKAEDRAKQENHCKIHRAWGFYEIVDMEPRFQVRRLTVNPGAALSLQMHLHRAEHWVVVKGTAKVTKGDEELLLTENQSTYVPIGVKHRLENSGTIPLEIIEVQSGSYLGEDDIVRYEERDYR